MMLNWKAGRSLLVHAPNKEVFMNLFFLILFVLITFVFFSFISCLLGILDVLYNLVYVGFLFNPQSKT